ncbi:MAG: hypothetical protein ACREIA_00225, partial [Opitutaceae bacterium]
TLVLAESEPGLILDWELYQGVAPAEWRQAQESIQRQNQFDISEAIKALGSDRGFHAREGSKQLREAGICDATCPRDPDVLKERFRDPGFARLQRRRASTEARIGILRERQGRRLRCRGFAHRCLAVAWSVIGHNLWMIARMLADQRAARRARDAA